jgi:hypothetical protein
MVRYVLNAALAAALAASLPVACDGGGGGGSGDADSDSDSDSGDAGPPPDPGAEFDRFCGDEPWDADLQPAEVHPAGGEYVGYYNTFPAETMETMKVIPPHPFQLTAIRVDFGGGSGTARIRLMRSFGRSYPDVDAEDGDLIAPVELTVESASPGEWREIDVSSQGVYLLPTEHYVIVYEHVDGSEPFLAIEEVAEGDFSRGLILVPGEAVPYGVEGNFRMQLKGNSFCRWEQDERWFAEDESQPFVDDGSQRAAVTDLDGDGHDDLVLNAGGPLAYLGDGAGGFAAPGFDPFQDAPEATMLVFGDLDNDGDRDAFAATYVAADDDGDGVTIAEGDCNDADENVHPGADEVAGNGYDDDCDLVADDGTDESDGDSDGFSIADGDCDDTRDDVHPGAPELLDHRDNDCDGEVDEEFFNTVLLNDGSGLLEAIETSGVELLDPSAAAALGDGDGDGVLDLYWGNWLVHYPDPPAVGDVYCRGLGDGTFEERTSEAGVTSYLGPKPCYGVLWADYDNDGWLDIWAGNYGYEPNFLFQNQGDGTFVEAGEYLGVDMDGVGGQGGNTFGGDFGDIDNDGDLDLYSANIAHPRYQPGSDPSTMLVNQGGSSFVFVEMREELGLHYDEGDVNAAFADFDNDMDLDLAVASLYRGHFSRLYRNDGEEGFTDVSYEAGVAVNDSVSVVWSDVDEDGDLDLITADRTGPPCVHLFVNRIGQQSGWVQLVLEGVTANRDAIGARVELEAGGVTQIREVRGGGGHSNTQQTRVVHFGLGGETAIDSLSVRWPGGESETIEGVEPGGRYRVVEGSGAGELVE